MRPRDNATNKPYESEKLNIEFNMRAIKKHGLPAQVVNPTIKTIGVVGALFDKDQNIYGHDVMIVQDALALLRATKISMAGLLKFHFYNLLAPISSDFLEASLLDNRAPKADALILCDIHGDRSGQNNFAKLRYDQQVTPYDNLEYEYLKDVDLYRDKPRLVGVSHIQQLVPEAWGRCADLVDAKLVFVAGSKASDCLVTDAFIEGGHYQVAIGSEEKLPRVNLGVVASNAHLEKLQKEVSPNHILGERILSLKSAPIQRAKPLLEMK